MPKASKNIKEDLNKNIPHTLPAIVNTVISVIFIVVVTVLRIMRPKDFSIGLYICFLVVLILFPISSWYTSYFSKKQKTKMLNNFEEETKTILDYIKFRKNYKTYTESKEVYVTAKYEKIDELNKKFTYYKEKSTLGYPDTKYALVSLGLGFVGLEIDPSTKEVITLKGVLPRSIWLKKNLKVPQSIKANVSIEPHGFSFSSKCYIQINKQDEIYYNPKNGWVCLGERKIYPIDEVVEFVSGALLVLREGKIISLWLRVGENLPLN